MSDNTINFPGINMIKRSQALHSLFTRGTPLSDANGKLNLRVAILTEPNV